MVTGGHDTNANTNVELLHSNGTRLCSLPNLPVFRYLHSQTGLLICGGGNDPRQRSCITFSEGSWKKTHTLRGRGRVGHNAWLVPQGVLLMGGGHSGTTTEVLTDSGQTTLSFNLVESVM